MRQECILAVGKAIGRSISQQEAQQIEQRIREAMKQIARQDVPAWQAMSRDDRLNAAAQLAGQQLLAEAGKKKQRIALTILAHDRLMNEYTSLGAQGIKPFQAIGKMLERVSNYTKGVTNEAFSRLTDTLDAVDSRFLGMVEDSRMAADLVREIFHPGSTGNTLASKGAKAWLETVESLRQRFNRAGGNIGKLDYGYLPQPHDQVRVLKAGQNQWVNDILPLLDRSRYLGENGVHLDDAQMVSLLEKA
jgi:hypothetical protein